MNHFAYIKRYANVIEERIDDEYFTLKSVLANNAMVLAQSKKNNVNIVLIDGEDNIDVDL